VQPPTPLPTAFTPAHMLSIADGTDHDIDRRLRAPTDDEGASDWPAFDGSGNYAVHRRFLSGGTRADTRLYAKIAQRRIVPPNSNMRMGAS
jgi:hypothetical protein